MDQTQVNHFKESLENMRIKVIAAKGETVEGLSKLPAKTDKAILAQSKIREANA